MAMMTCRWLASHSGEDVARGKRQLIRVGRACARERGSPLPHRAEKSAISQRHHNRARQNEIAGADDLYRERGHSASHTCPHNRAQAQQSVKALGLTRIE